jgi:hypothetical protein
MRAKSRGELKQSHKGLTAFPQGLLPEIGGSKNRENRLAVWTIVPGPFGAQS